MSNNKDLKKSELLQMKYKNAPVLKKKDIINSIKEYIENLDNCRYLLLNNRQLNYHQIFGVYDHKNNAYKIASYIYDFLTESGFIDNGIVFKMDEIVELYVDEENKDVLNIYYMNKGTLVEFVLVSAPWIVEEIM